MNPYFAKAMSSGGRRVSPAAVRGAIHSYPQNTAMRIASAQSGRKAFMSNKKLMMIGGGAALGLGYMAHRHSSARNAPMSPVSGYPSGVYGM